MSILFLDKSTCGICGKVIGSNDEHYSFPAFVNNAKDELYFYNDDNFHLSCLDHRASGEKAKMYADLFIERTRPASRICTVSGETITDPTKHICTGYLTSDINDHLHSFNFCTSPAIISLIGI